MAGSSRNAPDTRVVLYLPHRSHLERASEGAGAGGRSEGGLGGRASVSGMLRVGRLGRLRARGGIVFLWAPCMYPSSMEAGRSVLRAAPRVFEANVAGANDQGVVSAVLIGRGWDRTCIKSRPRAFDSCTMHTCQCARAGVRNR